MTNRLALFLALFVMSLCSCIGAEQRLPERQPRDSVTALIETRCYVAVIDSFILVMPEDVRYDPRRHSRLLEAFTAHVARWESSEGLKVKPTTIVVTDMHSFKLKTWVWWYYVTTPPLTGMVTINATGVYCPNTGRIGVTAGLHDELPSLLHELAHACSDSSADHRSPEWSRWDAMGDEVARKLRERRR